jgi:hypothetical protein
MWNARLRKPIRLTDGRTLKTREKKWQRLADLLVAAANSGNAALISVLTGNIEEALSRPPFTTARLANDETKKPAAESVRRKAPRKRANGHRVS